VKPSKRCLLGSRASLWKALARSEADEAEVVDAEGDVEAAAATIADRMASGALRLVDSIAMELDLEWVALLLPTAMALLLPWLMVAVHVSGMPFCQL
jgi:hypothetical protein